MPFASFGTSGDMMYSGSVLVRDSSPWQGTVPTPTQTAPPEKVGMRQTVALGPLFVDLMQTHVVLVPPSSVNAGTLTPRLRSNKIG